MNEFIAFTKKTANLHGLSVPPMRQFFILSAFLYSTFLFGQSFGKVNVDSLQNIVDKGLNDTNRVNALLSLTRYYRMKDPEKSYNFSKEADALSVKLSFWKGVSKAENSIAVYFKAKNENDSMFSHYAIARAYALKANDLFQLGLVYSNTGQAYYDLGNTEVALRYFIVCDSIGEKIDNKFLTLAGLNSIAGIYFSGKDFKLSKLYTNRMLKYAEKNNDQNTIASAYDNLGSIANAEGDGKAAIAYYFMSLKKYGGTSGIQFPKIYANIGETYYEMEKYDSSIYYSRLGLISDAGMSFPADVARLCENIGGSFLKLNQSDSALFYALKGYEAAAKGHSPIEADLHSLLSEIYASKKDFEKAFFHNRRYAEMQDSLNAAQDATLRNQMLARFDNQQKEKDIALQQKDIAILNEQRRNDRIVLIIVAVAGLLFLLLIYNRYQIKQKANKLLEAQNLEITRNRDEIGTKNKEITDSINYAKRIQEGLLPDEKLLAGIAKENFIFYLPRDIVSGDFYWISKKQHRIYIAVADCTGHGVPGALVSVIGINLLDQIMNLPGMPSTGEVLNHLHRMIISTLNKDVNQRETKDGMDIGLLCIDTIKQEAEYSGAARPLYYSNSKGVELVKGDRDSVGGEQSFDHTFSFSVNKIPLAETATFYLSTDGFVDQFGEASNKKFLSKRFLTMLETLRNVPLHEQQGKIGNAFAEWKGKLEQIDDVLVMGIKVEL